MKLSQEQDLLTFQNSSHVFHVLINNIWCEGSCSKI